MRKKGVELRSWVNAQDIEDVILPEIRRIWRVADISFSIHIIHHGRALAPGNRQANLDYLVNARRDVNGRADAERIKRLGQLIDCSRHSPMAINVYLVPYLGEKSRSNARNSERRIFVAEWRDKAARAKQPPIRFQLIEAEPFRSGSPRRTIAHEIGHLPGLRQPNKNHANGVQATDGWSPVRLSTDGC